ncbi:MAG: GIY-YIG nuclease family protein [archaeon]
MVLKNCIYKFLNKRNEIIYIGMAADLHKRISMHYSTSSHLEQECYDETTKILYCSLGNIHRKELELIEIRLINKFKPKYNSYKTKNKEYNFIHEMPTLTFEILETSKVREWIKKQYQKYKQENDELKTKIKSMPNLETNINHKLLFYDGIDDASECFFPTPKYKVYDVKSWDLFLKHKLKKTEYKSCVLNYRNYSEKQFVNDSFRGMFILDLYKVSAGKEALFLDSWLDSNFYLFYNKINKIKVFGPELYIESDDYRLDLLTNKRFDF